MLPSIEEQRETKSSQSSVTVIFHDGMELLGTIDSFHAREDAALSLSGALMVDILVSPATESLQSPLNEGGLSAHLHYGTRLRSLLHIEKFSAEVPRACSVWFVFGTSPNSRSQAAAAIVNTSMTEQRRCAAA